MSVFVIVTGGVRYRTSMVIARFSTLRLAGIILGKKSRMGCPTFLRKLLSTAIPIKIEITLLVSDWMGCI
jgi:hypothetical protein